MHAFEHKKLIILIIEEYFMCQNEKNLGVKTTPRLLTKTDWNPPSFFQKEIEEFKGPF